MLSDARAAWLAAWIDGEGSVMLNKRTYSGNSASTTNRSVYPHYRPVVVVACFTDERLEPALRAVVDGQVYRHRINGDPRTPRKRAQYTFRWNVSQIRLYLPQVLPWLVLKQDRAGLLLQAIEIKNGYRPGSEEFNIRYRASLDELYNQIRAMNTVGRTTEGGDV